MLGAALILAVSCLDLRPDRLLYMRKTHLPTKEDLIPSALRPYAPHLFFLCVCVCVKLPSDSYRHGKYQLKLILHMEKLKYRHKFS